MPFVSNHGAKRKGAILSAVLCEALRSPERDRERECAQMDAPLVSPALSMKFLRFHTSQTMRWTQSSNADNGFLPVARTHLLHHILTAHGELMTNSPSGRALPMVSKARRPYTPPTLPPDG